MINQLLLLLVLAPVSFALGVFIAWVLYSLAGHPYL